MRPPPTLVMLTAAVVATAGIVSTGIVSTGVASFAEPDSQALTAPPGAATGAPPTRPGVPAFAAGDRARATAWKRHARGTLPPFRLREAGPPLRLKPPPPRWVRAAPFSFQIGTLNVLGSQHTRGAGGFAPGPVRTARASSLIRTRGVDLLGLQEVQGDQLAVLYNQLPGYTIWPGRALGGNGVRLQIAFRSDLFELVDTGSIMTRFDFMYRPIPYVLLRDRATGGEFWVVDVHNAPGGQEVQRDQATGTQIALLNRLRATGRPVLVTGDMNEKAEWFCKVAAATGMVAANGGTGHGGCHVGAGPLRIDWIVGSGVDFYGYVQDGASKAGISDHFLIRAGVTVHPSNLVRTR